MHRGSILASFPPSYSCVDVAEWIFTVRSKLERRRKIKKHLLSLLSQCVLRLSAGRCSVVPCFSSFFSRSGLPPQKSSCMRMVADKSPASFSFYSGTSVKASLVGGPCSPGNPATQQRANSAAPQICSKSCVAFFIVYR